MILTRLTKVMIIYFLIIGSGIVSTTIYYNYQFENIKIPGKLVIGINLVKVVDVDREKIFDVMADIENYPKVLPDNFISLKIINQTHNALNAKVIFAEEKISEAGIITTIIVKHTILPYDRHEIEVMSGDARDSKITTIFKDLNSGTEIETDAQIHVHGILAPFGLLARPNLEAVINTVLESFVEYSRT